MQCLCRLNCTLFALRDVSSAIVLQAVSFTHAFLAPLLLLHAYSVTRRFLYPLIQRSRLGLRALVLPSFFSSFFYIKLLGVRIYHLGLERVANRPEFFGTVPNSDAVSRVPNGSFRGRLMSPIFAEQKSNVNNDPYFRFSPLIFAFEFT